MPNSLPVAFEILETPDWDWNKVFRHWVPGDPYQPELLTPEYYRVKYAVAQFVEPKSICEIGVRAGYSAAAFLLGAPEATVFVGIDPDEGHHGGVVGFYQHARTTLSHYPHVKATFYNDNSQYLTRLPDGPFDFVHVDGDHTYQGCRHDLEMVLDSGAKWILIDDIDFLVDVKNATLDVINERGIKEAMYVPDQGYRGNILIKNPKA